MNIIVELLQVYKCVCRPLNLIFQSRRKQGTFPAEWENVVPVNKKEDKHVLSINLFLYFSLAEKILSV